MRLTNVSKMFKISIFASFLAVLFFNAGIANAATITVNTTVDENGTGANCSLREAVNAANTDAAFGGCTAGAGADTINFSALFNTAQTIQTSVAQLVISSTITINGPGANLLTLQNVIPAGANSRVFQVQTAAILNLSGVTVTGGNTSAGNGGGGLLVSGVANLTNVQVTGNVADGYGGGLIYETAGTNSTITNSTISNNSSNGSIAGGGGAGIDNSANLTIVNSTISGNIKTSATGNGGGLYNFGGTVTITNSTITDNQAAGTGSAGGVSRFGGTVTVRNTIIAKNRNNSTTPDVGGAFTSSGYNLIGTLGTATGFTGTADQTGVSNTNAGLGVLANNSGQTPTHALIAGSFAIDKGTNFGSTTDQRGLARTFDQPSIGNAVGGNGTDIGAFEIQTVVAAGISINGRVVTNSGQGIRGAVIQLIDQNNNFRTVRTGTFGYFSFSDVEVGQTYIINVTSKGYEFDSMLITPLEDLNDVNITPLNGLNK